MKMSDKDVAAYTPYRIYDRAGKLVMTSDERCRYSPREELSLIDSGHRIMLGAQRVTKSRVLEMLKAEERR